MTITGWLQLHMAITLTAAGVLGLIIGSFLNVVIVRYPEMLKRTWRAESLQFLDQPVEAPAESFNLATPRSHCPHCRASIEPLHNIPVLGYLLAKGRCKACQKSISLQYLIIELVSALLAVLVVLRFGVSLQGLAALILSWGLLALSVIDIRHHLLPDTMTLSLMWLGLLSSTIPLFAWPAQAILGAAAGYLLLWFVAFLFKKIRGKDGMGCGDFKMMAVFGAWLGLGMLLNVLLLAAILGLITGLILIIFRKLHWHQHIAFGPFIALGGWLTLMFGPVLTILLSFWLYR